MKIHSLWRLAQTRTIFPFKFNRLVFQMLLLFVLFDIGSKLLNIIYINFTFRMIN